MTSRLTRRHRSRPGSVDNFGACRREGTNCLQVTDGAEGVLAAHSWQEIVDSSAGDLATGADPLAPIGLEVARSATEQLEKGGEMRVPMRVLRLTAVAPKVLASTLLTVMFLALLPPLLGLAGFLISVVVLALLAGGLLEEPTLRAFRGARVPGESEQAVLAPVLARLAAAGISVPDLYIDHYPQSAEPATVLGRRSLIVSRRLVEATYRGQVSHDEAAALVAHAVGRHHARPYRYDLALQVWTAPCSGLLAVAGRVGATAAWFPLVRLAWQLRFVTAIICVVQSAAEGRIVYGLIAGVFIALTYVVPAATRAIERRVEYAADTFTIDHGLSPVLLGLLRRGGWPVPLERLHRLSTSTGPPADDSATRGPALHLVRGTTSASAAPASRR